MTQRVVVLGGGGFVGSHIIDALDGSQYQAISVTRKDCDLADSSQREVLGGLVQDGDIVVCAAAKAPAKDLDMLIENVALMTNIIEAIRDKQLTYVLNVSSDAVFGDSMAPLDETSEMAPLNAHGIMHCMREKMLAQRINAPTGHIRPTLIFGQGDPHNGYGPNKFVRIAEAGEPISLFGEGEEQRDHVHVQDVATIAVTMIAQKTEGGINAVTGEVTSFMDIAKAAQTSANYELQIVTNPRNGPMPHNGYRAFDNSRVQQLCPGMAFTKVTDYVQQRVSGHASVQLAESA